MFVKLFKSLAPGRAAGGYALSFAFVNEARKVLKTPVKGLFRLGGKEAGGELVFAAMVGDALAAGASFLAVIGAGAVGSVFL